ncbi:metallophosphoesterase [Thalassolituus sp. LLYu03]|uniref:metallophosphoesterase n=1 Tax=Thalassolituus sp. LLYu03 TaxID=3421656 RepID=UPI003D28D0B1
MIIQPRLLKLGVNAHGRDFVIGDLHGCVSAMHRQLATLNFDYARDRLICVGDLVDRGPEPAEAMALLHEPWFFSVIGNHEQLIYEGFNEGIDASRELILQHGGDWILNQPRHLWSHWFRQMEDMPLGIELENHLGQRVGVVHAEYPLSDWADFESMSSEQAKRAIWAREPFREQTPGSVAGIDFVIYGHNVTDTELHIGNRFYIDAGAFRGCDFFIKDIDQLGNSASHQI